MLPLPDVALLVDFQDGVGVAAQLVILPAPARINVSNDVCLGSTVGILSSKLHRMPLLHNPAC